MSRKRVIFLSDLHGGHVVGLTPPGWQAASGALADKTAAIRRETWRWFAARMKALQPIYACIGNGDLVDGRGERSGGTELLSTDPGDQIDIAVAGLRETRAKHFALTYGTPYHTGVSSDIENGVAKELKAEIAGHLWPEVNGVIFDVKHKIGPSAAPHGRHTATARDRLWNMLWNERDEQPKARVMIRSHVHYHQFTGDGYWLGMTTPALQAAFTKYGGRQCSGTVDFGFVVFDIETNGEYSWHAELLKPEGTKAHTLSL